MPFDLLCLIIFLTSPGTSKSRMDRQANAKDRIKIIKKIIGISIFLFLLIFNFPLLTFNYSTAQSFSFSPNLTIISDREVFPLVNLQPKKLERSFDVFEKVSLSSITVQFFSTLFS